MKFLSPGNRLISLMGEWLSRKEFVPVQINKAYKGIMVWRAKIPEGSGIQQSELSRDE